MRDDKPVTSLRSLLLCNNVKINQLQFLNEKNFLLKIISNILHRLKTPIKRLTMLPKLFR